MIGRRGCISGTSCVTLTLIRSLAGRTIKRFYCLTGLCSHISPILIPSMMIVMMIHHTRAIPLLLVLLLLLHHDAFGRHVRGRGRRHVLGHLQGLLDFGRPSRWLLWPIALILWYEVLENADVVPAGTCIRRVIGGFSAEYRMNHKLVAMQLSVLLGDRSSIWQVPTEFTMWLVILRSLEWWPCKQLLLLLLLLHYVLNVLLLLGRGGSRGTYLLAFLVHLNGAAPPSYMPSPVHPIDALREQVLQCFIFFVEDVKVMIGVLSCLLTVVGLPLRVELWGLQLLSHHYCLSPARCPIARGPFLCHLRSVLGSHYS